MSISTIIHLLAGIPAKVRGCSSTYGNFRQAYFSTPKFAADGFEGENDRPSTASAEDGHAQSATALAHS